MCSMLLHHFCSKLLHSLKPLYCKLSLVCISCTASACNSSSYVTWLMHSYVRHDSFNMCDMQMCDMTPSTYLRVTWLMHSYVGHDSFNIPAMHSYVGHDSFNIPAVQTRDMIHGTCILMCDMIHVFLCATWLIPHTGSPYMEHDSCIHMWDMTHSFQWFGVSGSPLI